VLSASRWIIFAKGSVACEGFAGRCAARFTRPDVPKEAAPASGARERLGCRVASDAFLLRVPWSGLAKVFFFVCVAIPTNYM